MAAAFERFDPASGGTGAVIEDHPLGGPVLRLTANGGTAEVALQGAQLLSWQPKGHAPVIWMSPLERLATPPGNPKPVRGGTPVCWPWFGPHPTEAGKPAHGFVRTRQWTLEAAERTWEEVRIVLGTSTTAIDQTVWPYQARVQLCLTLGATLTLALTTDNTGTDGFALTQALHTYFAVGDIATVTVEGFDGQAYIDKVDGNHRKSQSGSIGFGSETDCIYDQHPDRCLIVDPGLGRCIGIAKTGSRSSVVWNPWAGKAGRLGDMGPDGWRRMLCVETCNAGDDIVRLAPGASHTLAATYTISLL